MAPGSITSWDMDDDQDIDLAVVVNDDERGQIIRILRNDSVLTPGNVQIAFTLFEPIGEGENPKLVREADVTGDQAEDLVAVNVTNAPLDGAERSGPASSLSIRPNLLKGPQMPGDVNGDGNVNVIDLLAVISNWGPCSNPNNCPADIAPPGPPQGDDQVNVQDLLMVISKWG
jgi:hypothetical protein